MSDPKEIDYFTLNYYKGEEWYKSHFITDKKLCGESSQNYTKRHDDRFSDAPKRIQNDLPEAKLIYIVRDPIKRIISHIHENISAHEYKENFNFDQYILENPDNHWVQCSKYNFQLDSYASYLERDKILVITLEDLKFQTLDTLNQVYEFLGVCKGNFIQEVAAMNTFNSKYYLSSFSKFLTRNKRLSEILKANFTSSIERIKGTNFYKNKILKRSVSEVILQDTTISVLSNQLKGDMEAFSRKYLSGKKYDL
jgi:hypothetical protein